ncbi:MAG: exonuclease SbcCD subunit D [Leptolyngbyaceae cyanobacterium SM1_3_5]|nr:exonuclease SbcCD subunit D [Leptolyngbyaceae cyanobacterium SM1_3_5]
MARFLHVADVHLGYDRYDNKTRSLDFFYAFKEALEKYAIGAQVDFVVVAGDLFEHRNIQPAILNQAEVCLRMLHDEGIPVFAIEGNHDNRPFGTKTSWLSYLAARDLIVLLEPDFDSGAASYQAWSSENLHGGYVDLPCGVRIIGSNWYGVSAPKAIEQLADAIQQLPPAPPHTVLMLHQGMEGQISRYSGALHYSEVLPLRSAGVSYLALGHIHKNYEIENWIFNPGSIEANSVEESRYARGVYLVEIDENGVRAHLKRDYRQRSIVQLRLMMRGNETIEQVEAQSIACVQNAIEAGDLDPDKSPIVELRIEGQVGFDRLDLDTRRLQQKLQQQSNALVFLLKYEVDALAYNSPLAEDATRLQIEQEIFTDLVTANSTYKKRSTDIVKGLMQIKDLQQDGRAIEDLYQFAQQLLEVRS